MSVSDEMQRRLARLERLRKLGLNKGAGQVKVAFAHAEPTPVTPGDALLPGRPVETPFGQAWVREERYPVRGHPALAEWLGTDPACLAALDRNPALAMMVPAEVAFIDTETTGLSLGTGTYTFLIGIGTFEQPALTDPGRDGYEGWELVVRQFFMRNPGEERAQLHLVEELFGRCTGIVSFNGRGFDMPLIYNRFVLAQAPPPLVGAPHLDLLPPARRLYKLRWGACNLGALERNVLGLERTAEDVPGYLIPDIYRSYYRTGEATDMLVRVFYHNLQDVVSMALLGARMARCFRVDHVHVLAQELHPLECLSLGRCYDALEWIDAGVLVYRAAAANGGPGEQAAALRELAFLYKRLDRREQAAALWEEWISSVPGDDLTPYVELAKHHEWHTGDLEAARGWARWALSIAQGMTPGFAREQAVAELERRVARVEGKLAGRAAVPGSE